MSTRFRTDIFLDTVCPWCYLGKRRFELALAARPQYEPTLNWRPFELNPDLPWDGVERAGHIAGKFGDSTQIADAEAALVRHGEAVGLQFRFDLIARLPNTRRSHLLIAHAGRHDLANEVTERVMQAYFEEGCNIGDIEELVRLGVEAGLSERETRAAMVLREGQDGVVAAERHAAVLGITGVPAFIFDRQYSSFGRPGGRNVHQVHRPSRGARRRPRNGFVTPAELTGRARGHIVELECSPGRPCARRRAPRRHPERCPSRDARARDHAVLGCARRPPRTASIWCRKAASATSTASCGSGMRSSTARRW